MIELTGYIPPAKGERYTTKKIWVNPDLIVTISTFSVVIEREASGRYLDELMEGTSIGFAAAYDTEQVGITVIETPRQILNAIHCFRRGQKEYLK